MLPDSIKAFITFLTNPAGYLLNQYSTPGADAPGAEGCRFQGTAFASRIPGKAFLPHTLSATGTTLSGTGLIFSDTGLTLSANGKHHSEGGKYHSGDGKYHSESGKYHSENGNDQSYGGKQLPQGGTNQS